jgi:hypothetical protein
MTNAASPGHTDSEYLIGLTLKCPLSECIEGQTDRQTNIFALYDIDYIDSINRFLTNVQN